MQCTLNMYGSDVVRGDSQGVENRPPKSGSLFALHTDTLSFISKETRVGQSGAARTLWKWGLPRTCVPVFLIVITECAVYVERVR